MILPTEWKRIASSSTVIPWFEAMEFLQRQRFDYIVTGEFDLRYASDPNAWAAYSGRRDSPSFRCRLKANSRNSHRNGASGIDRVRDRFGYDGDPVGLSRKSRGNCHSSLPSAPSWLRNLSDCR